MRTKELIKELRKEDPSGELECVVGGEPIFFLQNLPAYYDGSLQCLVQDPDKSDGYDVVGAKFTDKGRKIEISTFTVEDAILEDLDLPVDCSEVGDAERKEKQVKEWRKKSKDLLRLVKKREEK